MHTCRQQLGAFPDVVFLSGGNWYHVEKRSMEQFQADLAELETAVADADAAAQQASCATACLSRWLLDWSSGFALSEVAGLSVWLTVPPLPLRTLTHSAPSPDPPAGRQARAVAAADHPAPGARALLGVHLAHAAAPST